MANNWNSRSQIKRKNAKQSYSVTFWRETRIYFPAPKPVLGSMLRRLKRLGISYTPSERLVPLGIIGAQLRAPLVPLGTILSWGILSTGRPWCRKCPHSLRVLWKCQPSNAERPTQQCWKASNAEKPAMLKAYAIRELNFGLLSNWNIFFFTFFYSKNYSLVNLVIIFWLQILESTILADTNNCGVQTFFGTANILEQVA